MSVKVAIGDLSVLLNADSADDQLLPALERIGELQELPRSFVAAAHEQLQTQILARAAASREKEAEALLAELAHSRDPDATAVQLAEAWSQALEPDVNPDAAFQAAFARVVESAEFVRNLAFLEQQYAAEGAELLAQYDRALSELQTRQAQDMEAACSGFEHTEQTFRLTLDSSEGSADVTADRVTQLVHRQLAEVKAAEDAGTQRLARLRERQREDWREYVLTLSGEGSRHGAASLDDSNTSDAGGSSASERKRSGSSAAAAAVATDSAKRPARRRPPAHKQPTIAPSPAKPAAGAATGKSSSAGSASASAAASGGAMATAGSQQQAQPRYGQCPELLSRAVWCGGNQRKASFALRLCVGDVVEQCCARAFAPEELPLRAASMRALYSSLQLCAVLLPHEAGFGLGTAFQPAQLLEVLSGRTGVSPRVRDFVRACEGGTGECHFSPLRLQLEQAARDAAADSGSGLAVSGSATRSDKRGTSRSGSSGKSKASDASADGKQRNGSRAGEEDKPATPPAAAFRWRAGDLLVTRHSNLLSAHLALHVFCGGGGGVSRKIAEGGGGESKDGAAESEDLSQDPTLESVRRAVLLADAHGVRSLTLPLLFTQAQVQSASSKARAPPPETRAHMEAVVRAVKSALGEIATRRAPVAGAAADSFADAASAADRCAAGGSPSASFASAFGSASSSAAASAVATTAAPASRHSAPGLAEVRFMLPLPAAVYAASLSSSSAAAAAPAAEAKGGGKTAAGAAAVLELPILPMARAALSNVFQFAS